MAKDKTKTSSRSGQSNSLFLQIPSELFLCIFEYMMDMQLSDRENIRKTIQMMANMESLSSQLTNRKEIRECFNNFWWRVFELEKPITEISEFVKIKEEMTRKNCFKRKILLTRYVRRNILQPVDRKSSDVKVYVTGCQYGGKTSIIRAYMQGYFDPSISYDPTIEDVDYKFIEVDGKVFRFDLQDDNYRMEYSSMKSMYMNNAHCFVIVCSAQNCDVGELTFNIELLLKAKNQPVHDYPIVFAINQIGTDIHVSEIEECEKKLKELISKYELVNSEIVTVNPFNSNTLGHLFEQLIRRFGLGSSETVLDLLQNVIKEDTKILKKPKKEEKCFVM